MPKNMKRHVTVRVRKARGTEKTSYFKRLRERSALGNLVAGVMVQ